MQLFEDIQNLQPWQWPSHHFVRKHVQCSLLRKPKYMVTILLDGGSLSSWSSFHNRLNKEIHSFLNTILMYIPNLPRWKKEKLERSCSAAIILAGLLPWSQTAKQRLIEWVLFSCLHFHLEEFSGTSPPLLCERPKERKPKRQLEQSWAKLSCLPKDSHTP